MISSATAVVAMPIEEAYRRVTSMDPSSGLYPRFGPLPAVVAVREQVGDWSAVGQSHRLELSDGSTVLETIQIADAPRRFSYRLTEFTKLFGGLVLDARADWRFEAVTGGTRVVWDYRFNGLPGRRWVVAGIQRLFWAPYMRRVLPGIVRRAEQR